MAKLVVMMNPTIQYLTDIYFGCGMLQHIGTLCEGLGVMRPLLVTDRVLMGRGFANRVAAPVAAVFAEVPTNPTEDCVMEGRDVYREHHCDGIIALGGGSPMDCAKAISILATHPEPLGQYAFIKGGSLLLSSKKPPVIAVPTTAGTGSEVGRGALITMRSGEKLGIIGKPVLPVAAVCDPELTLDLPPRITAATGMDAIVWRLTAALYAIRSLTPLHSTAWHEHGKIFLGSLKTRTIRMPGRK